MKRSLFHKEKEEHHDGFSLHDSPLHIHHVDVSGFMGIPTKPKRCDTPSTAHSRETFDTGAKRLTYHRKVSVHPTSSVHECPYNLDHADISDLLSTPIKITPPTRRHSMKQNSSPMVKPTERTLGCLDWKLMALEARLRRFYGKYNPDKIHDVRQVAAKYKDRVHALMSALENKYGPENAVIASAEPVVQEEEQDTSQVSEKLRSLWRQEEIESRREREEEEEERTSKNTKENGLQTMEKLRTLLQSKGASLGDEGSPDDGSTEIKEEKSVPSSKITVCEIGGPEQHFEYVMKDDENQKDQADEIDAPPLSLVSEKLRNLWSNEVSSRDGSTRERNVHIYNNKNGRPSEGGGITINIS